MTQKLIASRVAAGPILASSNTGLGDVYAFEIASSRFFFICLEVTQVNLGEKTDGITRNPII